MLSHEFVLAITRYNIKDQKQTVYDRSVPTCLFSAHKGGGPGSPVLFCPRATFFRHAGVCITRGPVCLPWSFAVLHPVLLPVGPWFNSAINTRLLVLLAFRKGRGYGSNCNKAKKYLHPCVRHKFIWKCISCSPSLGNFSQEQCFF